MDIFDQISDFLSSDYFRWIIYGILIYLGVLWFALVAWVARDIVGRSRSLFFQTMMILLNMGLPVFGLFVYLLLRPPKTLLEKYYDEVEYRMLQETAELHDYDDDESNEMLLKKKHKKK